MKLKQSVLGELKVAQQYHISADVQKARASYQEIILRNPDCAAAYHELGVLESAHGTVADTLSKLSMAVKIAPKNGSYRETYLKILLDANKFDVIELQMAEMFALLDIEDVARLVEVCLCCLGCSDTKLRIYQKNLGSISRVFGYLQSIGAHDKILKISQVIYTMRPVEYSIHKSIGMALVSLERDKDADDVFHNNCLLFPKIPDAFYNRGLRAQILGLLSGPEEDYLRCLALDPNFHHARNNLAVLYLTKGKIADAIDQFTVLSKEVMATPANFLNLTSLNVQVNIPNYSNLLSDFCELKELKTLPQYHLYESIQHLMEDQYRRAEVSLDKYQFAMVPSVAQAMHKTDLIFNEAYYIFLKELIKLAPMPRGNASGESEVIHIGDSHCLSLANQFINIKGVSHKIRPIITFGAKAYHLGSENENKYKGIVSYQCRQVPRGSKVFVSFGEIDCRIDEGFLTSGVGDHAPLIEKVVERYINWFTNLYRDNDLYFTNVPAPVFDQRFSKSENDKAAQNINIFNDHLSNCLSKVRCNLLDVHKLTLGVNGYSNGEHHIDNRHLGPSIIPLLEMGFMKYF